MKLSNLLSILAILGTGTAFAGAGPQQPLEPEINIDTAEISVGNNLNKPVKITLSEPLPYDISVNLEFDADQNIVMPYGDGEQTLQARDVIKFYPEYPLIPAGATEITVLLENNHWSATGYAYLELNSRYEVALGQNRRIKMNLETRTFMRGIGFSGSRLEVMEGECLVVNFGRQTMSNLYSGHMTLQSGAETNVDSNEVLIGAASQHGYSHMQELGDLNLWQHQEEVHICPQEDGLPELTEIVQLEIASLAAGYAAVPGREQITVAIIDKDTQTNYPRLAMEVTDYGIGNTESGCLTYQISLDHVCAEEVQVDFGKAYRGRYPDPDFTVSNMNLVFAPGETVKTVEFCAVEDTLQEGYGGNGIGGSGEHKAVELKSIYGALPPADYNGKSTEDSRRMGTTIRDDDWAE